MAKFYLILLLAILSVNGCFLCEINLQESGGLNAFIKGIYNGFQLNPNYPSPCLRKISDAKTDWADAVKNFIDIFKYGDLSLYFDTVSDIATMMNDIDDSVSICQLDLLTNQLTNLFSPSEASAVSLRITVNSDRLINYWALFTSNWGVDNLKSGENLGKFLSIILDYQI